MEQTDGFLLPIVKEELDIEFDDCCPYSTPDHAHVKVEKDGHQPKKEEISPLIEEQTAGLFGSEKSAVTDIYSKSVDRRCGLTVDTRSDAKKLFICDYCGKTCATKGDLTVHILRHTGKKTYQCTTSDKSCVSKSNLTRHKRTHTGERPFQCTYCGKAFSVKGALTVHIRSHTGERPYQCTYCDQSCLSKSNLSVHIRTHTGDRPYQCTYCGKAFSVKGALTVHIRTHTGDRPYECTTCDKSFVSKSKLTRHIRTHTGVRPYRCSYCDKAFVCITELTFHTRSHTEEKPYSCTYCNKAFSFKSNLTAHMRPHTDSARYQCTQCKMLCTESELTKHICTCTEEESLQIPVQLSSETKGKLHPCSYSSGSSLTKDDDITAHTRTSTGDTLYINTNREKSFATKSHLACHADFPTSDHTYALTTSRCSKLNTKLTSM